MNCPPVGFISNKYIIIPNEFDNFINVDEAYIRKMSKKGITFNEKIRYFLRKVKIFLKKL